MKTYRGDQDCKNRPRKASVFIYAAVIETRTIAWNSLSSFCIGVPESMIRRGVLRASNMVEVLLLADLSLWPSGRGQLRLCDVADTTYLRRI